ncbi:MAG: uracil-DNA glycosylase family protein, partial [Acidithiobacillus sp.]|uniref:uracil-DNA glycosylase family protein n=1 Tax=Acidithiobacillus sp. TaxID=1872118 RepID=UPI00355F2427
DVFWANVIKCPPPGYRSPTFEEIHNCIPYLQHQLDLIKPKIIICFGKFAKYVFETKLVNTKATIVKTYHPTYLQRYAKTFVRKDEEEKIVNALKHIKEI